MSAPQHVGRTAVLLDVELRLELLVVLVGEIAQHLGQLAIRQPLSWQSVLNRLFQLLGIHGQNPGRRCERRPRF